MSKTASAITVLAATLIAASAAAQSVKRTPLQNTEFPPGYATVTAIAEVSGTCAGRHTHPGIETSYVMEGQLVLKVAGKPDQTFKPGDSFTVPANTPHDACTVAGQPFKVLAVYVVEQGKPLATPTP